MRTGAPFDCLPNLVTLRYYQEGSSQFHHKRSDSLVDMPLLDMLKGLLKCQHSLACKCYQQHHTLCLRQTAITPLCSIDKLCVKTFQDILGIFEGINASRHMPEIHSIHNFTRIIDCIVHSATTISRKMESQVRERTFPDIIS